MRGFFSLKKCPDLEINYFCLYTHLNVGISKGELKKNDGGDCDYWDIEPIFLVS